MGPDSRHLRVCRGGEAKLGRLCGPRARVGGQAGLAGLARKAEQAWAIAAPSSFLSLFLILFSILFSFLFYLLSIWLGFDLFSFMYKCAP